MKRMNAQIIGLAVLAVLGVAFYMLTMQGEEAPEPEFLMPGLDEARGDVEQVTLTALGGDAVTLRSGEYNWVVAEKQDFPADFERLLGLLEALAEAKLVEAKTGRPENHGRLGLAAEGEPGETGVQVEIMAGDASYDVVIGRQSDNRDATFVRRPNEDQTWLIDKAVTATADAAEWVTDIAVNVSSGDVQAVEIVTAAGDVLKVEREEEGGGFKVQDVPSDKELRYTTIGDTLGRALVNVRLQDVAMIDEADWKRKSETRFELKNGDVVRAYTMQQDDDSWLRLEFELQDDSELYEYEGRDAWQYKISQYAYDALNKTMADMLKEEEDDS